MASLKEIFRATWHVMWHVDKDGNEKSKKRSDKDVQQHLAQLEKDKSIATAKGEPWVAIVDMDVDYSDLTNGSFELDWNDQFVTRLLKFGYQGKEDADLVDQWFNDVCRNIVLETYEQGAADLHPVKSSDLGNGRREYK